MLQLSSAKAVDAIPSRRLSNGQLVAYSAPAIPIGLSLAGFMLFMPAYYAKYTSVTLVEIGAALLVARLLEAALLPLIGILSDRTRTRIGARKPWMIAGAILAPVATGLLYNPGPDTGWLHFFLASSLFLISWSFVQIPTTALGIELSHDYDERTRIFTVYAVAAMLGAVAFAAIPLLPISTEAGMSPAVVRTIGWVILLLFPATVLAAVLGTPNVHAVVKSEATAKIDARSVLRNKPFLMLVSAWITGGTATGMIAACWFFFMDTQLKLGDFFPHAVLSLYIGSCISAPVWQRIIRRIGKHKAWALGWCGSAFVTMLLLVIPAEAPIPVIGIFFLVGMGTCIENVAPNSVLGDVVDYDTLRFGVDRAGNYTAITAVVMLANVALGGAVAMFILSVFGFDAKGGTNDAAGSLGLVIAMFAVPTILYAMAAFLLWHFPIDARRQAIIRKRIDDRRARAERCGLNVP